MLLGEKQKCFHITDLFFNVPPPTFSDKNRQEKVLKLIIMMYNHTKNYKFVRTNLNVKSGCLGAQVIRFLLMVNFCILFAED